MHVQEGGGLVEIERFHIATPTPYQAGAATGGASFTSKPQHPVAAFSGFGSSRVRVHAPFPPPLP
jgi:hypothetical protein